MWSSIALSFVLSTHAQAEEVAKPQFQLVGFYDLASLMTTSGVNGSSFSWTPSPKMEKSCGNAKENK